MDMEAFGDIMETIATVLGVLFDVSKWLNSNIFSNIGGLVDVLKKVIDFFAGLFSGDTLDGIKDFFGGLFG